MSMDAKLDTPHGKTLLSRFGPSNRKVFPWVLMAPTLIILFALGIYPFLYALYIAAHNFILSKPYPALFRGALPVPVRHPGPGVLARAGNDDLGSRHRRCSSNLAGPRLALLFARRLRGIGFMRLFILIPMILPPLVAALIWRYMFYPGAGLATYYVGMITDALGWEPSRSCHTRHRLPDADLRGHLGVDALHVSHDVAGLASIPRQPYEAAKSTAPAPGGCSGPSPCRCCAPAILIAVVIRTMDAFRTYELHRHHDARRARNATTTLNVYLTKTGLEFFDASKAARSP